MRTASWILARAAVRGLAPSLLLVAVGLAAGPLAAQAAEVSVAGQLLQADGQPAAGYRVVFRVVDRAEVYLTKPTDDQGRFRVALPAGESYLAVAVLSPAGRRTSLRNQPPFAAQPGITQAIQLEAGKPRGAAAAPPFLGADRLFLGFVEDVPLVQRWRAEAQFTVADLDGADALQSTFVAAHRLRKLERLELGGRVGYAGVDFDGSFADGTGVTDVDLWARYGLAHSASRKTRLAVGGLLTLPTGDEDTGLSADALRAKLFGAARFDVSRVTLAAHAGLRFNDDGEIFGVDVDGSTAVAASIAALLPHRERLVLVGELSYEGERFDGGDADTRLLVGANWRAFRDGVLRAALAAGLSDGAPDTQLLLGYAFEF